MTKLELEKRIISNIKEEMILFPEYKNYTFPTTIKDAISKAMFGYPIQSTVIYRFENGCGKGKHATNKYRKQLITDEEITKVEKVYNAMIKKEILVFSKSGKMIKLAKEI